MIRDALANSDFVVLLWTLFQPSLSWYFLIKQVLIVISLVLECFAWTLPLMHRVYVILIFMLYIDIGHFRESFLSCAQHILCCTLQCLIQFHIHLLITEEQL